MSEVDVQAIEHPRDTARFVETWKRVYRDDPHWVPPLLFERKQFFHPRKNPYFKSADVQCFIAYRAGEALGTIAATVDHVYQEHEAGVGFFGFFEFIDDFEVADALFRAAREWLLSRGMKSVIGPANFNTNHEFALLVDGFDSDPYVANPHNSAYFPAMYEKLGLTGVTDWYAYTLDAACDEVQRIHKISDRFLKRHPEVTVRDLDMKNFEREVEFLHQIYTDAWEQNWGHVHISREEFYHLAKGFKGFIDPSLCYVAEIKGVPAAISITLPDMNQVVKKMNGRIFPTGWWHLLRRKSITSRVRVFMLGVKHEFQSVPLGAPLYSRTWRRGVELGIREGEASLVLESNFRMRKALERMGGTISKTYRSYEYPLMPRD
jgi:hypothetical protein